MTDRLPMICDSCAHLVPGTFRCTAYRTGITLDPLKAELHDAPRDDQDNEVVYKPDPRKAAEREAFLKYRQALLGGT